MFGDLRKDRLQPRLGQAAEWGEQAQSQACPDRDFSNRRRVASGLHAFLSRRTSTLLQGRYSAQVAPVPLWQCCCCAPFWQAVLSSLAAPAAGGGEAARAEGPSPDPLSARPQQGSWGGPPA